MLPYILALSIGVIAGLRAATPVAAIAWAGRLGLLAVQGTPLAFLTLLFAPAIGMMMAITELLYDTLPTTPSRTAPLPVLARIASGTFCGAAIGLGRTGWLAGAALGAAGATTGTLGGHAIRAGLARAFGHDLPAALIEDLVAIGGAGLVVVALR